VNHRRSVDNCKRCQNRGLDNAPGQVRQIPEFRSGGIRHRGGVTVMTGAGVELGKLSPRCQGRRSSGEPVRVRVPMRSTVAELCIVARKEL